MDVGVTLSFSSRERHRRPRNFFSDVVLITFLRRRLRCRASTVESAYRAVFLIVSRRSEKRRTSWNRIHAVTFFVLFPGDVIDLRFSVFSVLLGPRPTAFFRATRDGMSSACRGDPAPGLSG